VIAYRAGSVPEVVTDGLTGFVVASIDEAVAAVGRLEQLSRQACRAEFERRFTAERMARDYVAVYEKLVAAARSEPLSVPVVADSTASGSPQEITGP
jgi:glycosyltransferase involved in cell wall biosynthesis